MTRYLGCDHDFGTIDRAEVQATIDKFAPVVEIARTPKAPSILNTTMVATKAEPKSGVVKKLAKITYKMKGLRRSVLIDTLSCRTKKRAA